MKKFSIKNYPFRNPDLPLDKRIDDLISRLTLEEKISLIPTKQPAIKRLGIKEYSVGGEAAHGWVSREGDKATVFPQTIGLACSWDTELMERIGSIIADEARAYHKMKNTGLTLWAPTVDMERDPRWGRTEEAYGEDPHLTGEMASALVKGMQGTDPHYLKMAATLKHFFANNNEQDRGCCSASINSRNMKEYYLSPFKTIIRKAKVTCIMTAYNEVNGIPCILNEDVKKIVKDKWGLSGFVVSDENDFNQIVTMHKYYQNYDQSVADTLKSGVDCIIDDVELVKNALRSALEKGLLAEGDLDQALKNIFKIRFRLGEFDPDRLNPYAKIDRSFICREENKRLALEAACKSIVLLKNENNILPIQKENLEKIAVIGPLADEVFRDWYTGTLPYKVTPLQGIKDKLDDVEITFAKGTDLIALKSIANERYISPEGNKGVMLASNKYLCDDVLFELTDWGWGNFTLKSIKNNKYLTIGQEKATPQEISASADEVYGWFVKESYNLLPEEDGSYILRTWNDRLVALAEKGQGPMIVSDNVKITNSNKFSRELVEHGIKKAVAVAEKADLAIVCVGNNPLINGKEEIDRDDIILPPAQEELIKSVYEVNPNTVVVLISSYPVAINWADNNIPAIIYSSHGGQELGTAIAETLFGDYHPAGRLNMTWYKSIEQLPDMMEYDIIKGKRTYMYFDGQPLYPFGHGLSYTKFKYSGLRLSNKKINADQALDLTFKVENIGSYNSDEVVQLYISSENSKVMRPQKELKGFKRINLDPGDSKVVSFNIPTDELKYWDVTRENYVVETGIYKIMIGSSSEDIRLKEKYEVIGELIPPRKLDKMTEAQNFDDYQGVILDEIRDNKKTYVRFTNENDWIVFKDVDFGNGVNRLKAVTYNKKSEQYSVEIRLGSPEGTLLGECSVKEGKLNHIEVPIVEIKGIQNIYFKGRGDLGLYKFKFFKN